MSTLLLVDGHSQAYRAFFGMKTPLTTRSGEPTAAVYGFTRKLLSVFKEHKPDYVAVAFDVGDTWRHEEFADYKATRERMPDEMRVQMPRIEDVVNTFNIPIVTRENYEADDVLGTLSQLAAQQEIDVLIMTGDRDLFQLVNKHVKILYTAGGPNPRSQIYGPEDVEKRYQLTPQQFIDLKALVGDSSDNIPGVPGVGEKTAIKYLHQYETLDNVYAHIEEIRGPKARQKLADAEEQVRLNKRLVTIVTDLDIDFDPETYRLKNYDQQKVIDLFNQLEFKSLLRDLPSSDTGDIAGTTVEDTDTGQMALLGLETGDEPETIDFSHDYLCVQDEASLQTLVEALQTAPQICFDVETDSVDAVQTKLIGLGVAWGAGKAAYIPIDHEVLQEGETQLSWNTIKAAIQPFFANPEIPKVAHNSKFDLTVCLQHGLAVEGVIHDTMIMAWLLDPLSRRLGLKAQAAEELNWNMIELTDLIGTGRNQITMDQVEIHKAAAYCGADVDVTIQLYPIIEGRLKDANMWDLYQEVELPLIPILTDMEITGIRLDTDVLQEMSVKLTERLGELQKEMFDIVGHEFNMRSTQQMSQVLFDEMGFPTKGMKKTKSGSYSTAVSVLEKLGAMRSQLSRDQSRLIENILEQRQLDNLRGTYVDALPTLVNPKTERVHTNFNQTGAATGRLSSSNPNLQNIPIRTDLGRQIRRAFVAQEGWQLMAADYSQVELRVMAHVAEETALIDAFSNDQDIHAATAAKLFTVDIGEVTSDQRGLAKTINFATIYGSSAFGLSTRTDMSPKEAQHFMDQYFATYPRIQSYISDTIQQVNTDGYVETLLGRRREFLELKNENVPYVQRQGIERAAINAPIQGAAADIMKLAMTNVYRRLRHDGLQANMLLQIHDEIVLEFPPEERDALVKLVREEMESAYSLSIPLKVDVEIGYNWYEMDEA
ncbi:MAG: DNA polymerase I [Chloroflexota bacterium]